jgi:hypothetical protein
MKLANSTKKFAKTSVSMFNELTETWDELPEIFGSFFAYDRFISDRAFGQKKRLFETPITMKLPMDPAVRSVFKFGSANAIFLIEAENEDIQLADPFANIYSLRQLTWPVEIKKKAGDAWASGVPKLDAEVVIDKTWADYDRYTVNKSSESPGVGYTVETVILPRSTVVDTDCRVYLDNSIFEVNEVSTLLNQLYLRVQKVGVKGP